MIFWREKKMEKPLNIFPKLVEKKRWEGLRGFDRNPVASEYLTV